VLDDPEPPKQSEEELKQLKIARIMAGIAPEGEVMKKSKIY